MDWLRFYRELNDIEEQSAPMRPKSTAQIEAILDRFRPPEVANG